MRIVTPRAIGDTQYASSNIAEDDYSEWASGTMYDAKDFVLVAATHSIYQAIIDHTADADNSPTAEAAALADPLVADPDPAHWVYVSQSNRWRLFDQRPTQRTENASLIEADIYAPANTSDILAFVNLGGCTEIEVCIENGGRKVRIAWDEAPDGGDDITHYEYRQRADSGDSWGAWTIVPGSDATTTFFDLEELAPLETGYQFEVRAVNGVGGGAGSATADISITSYSVDSVIPAAPTGNRLAVQPDTTPATVPDAPENVEAAQSRREIYLKVVSLADDNAVVDWFSYFFTDPRLLDQLLLEIPPTVTADTIYIDLRGNADLACGQIVLGLSETIGTAIADNTGLEALDFSHAETDIYGNLTTVEREAVDIYNFQVQTVVACEAQLASAIRSQKGGKRGIWLAEENPRLRGWIYGFLRDYRARFERGSHVYSQIHIQGVT